MATDTTHDPIEVVRSYLGWLDELVAEARADEDKARRKLEAATTDRQRGKRGAKLDDASAVLAEGEALVAGIRILLARPAGSGENRRRPSRASTPVGSRASATKASTQKASAPKGSAAKASAPKGSAARTSTPKASAPKAATTRTSTPKASTTSRRATTRRTTRRAT
jgi:hypothetical protein